MTVAEAIKLKKDVEKALESLLTKLQQDTGCKVSQVNVWESVTPTENGNSPIVITQIIMKL